MLGTLLAQVGVPLLVKAVGGALSQSENDTARAAGETLRELDGEIEAGRVPPEQLDAANRHIERMAEIEARSDRAWLEQVNRTMRAEVASDDPFVRRMRPTFGYVLALTWAGQMGAVAYVVATDPAAAGTVVGALGELGTIWSVGLSVLGIYVYKRSQEKQGAGADTPGGLLGRLGKLLGGARGTKPNV